MGAFSRTKGHRGERDVSALIQEHTGWAVSRRVRQHDGDSDLLGVPGWSVEVKNCAKSNIADVRRWWEQTINQACGQLPLLVYKRQRGQWRAVWPISIVLTQQTADMWSSYEWTIEGDIRTWAAVARDNYAVD